MDTSSARQSLDRFFVDHPASVDETYGEHARVAAHFAGQLALASMAAAVHAIVPGLCKTTASTKIKALYAEMTAGARAPLASVHLPPALPVQQANAKTA